MTRIVVGITGASGMPLAERTVEALSDYAEIELVVTDGAKSVMAHETGGREATLATLDRYVSVRYDESNLAAPIASGSYQTAGMVVVPCSMKSLAGIATGVSDSLLQRAADVTLKERRRLVLVPRETPLRARHLDQMSALASEGADIVPPVLGFYFQPESMEDQIDYLVGKVLERFDFDHDRYTSWGEDG